LGALACVAEAHRPQELGIVGRVSGRHRDAEILAAIVGFFYLPFPAAEIDDKRRNRGKRAETLKGPPPCPMPARLLPPS